MAETFGSLVDKIAIAELKIHHMERETQRKDVEEVHRNECRQRLGVLKAQRNDLTQELDELLESYREGKSQPKIYRQFKMYNDPKYQRRIEP